jgi:hypothetical protein
MAQGDYSDIYDRLIEHLQERIADWKVKGIPTELTAFLENELNHLIKENAKVKVKLKVLNSLYRVRSVIFRSS